MTRESFTPRKEQRRTSEPEGAVLLRGDFYADFALEASRVRPGGEVATLAMYIGPGEAAGSVLNVFSSIPEAMRPHVGMHEYHDDYTRAAGNNEIQAVDTLIPWRRGQAKQNQQDYTEMMDQFKELGVISHVLNPIDGFAQSVFPMTGRSHLKGSYVKNGKKSIYYIQTGNHEDGPRDDFFIKITGEPANKLIDVFKELVEEGGPKEDTIYPISDTLSVYYDSGQKGKSIILNKARSIARGAKKNIRNISLFYPDGIRQELADAAKAGVDVRVIATKYYLEGMGVNINNMFYAIDKLAEITSHLRGDTFNVLRDPFNWAHAKTLIADDGETGELIGFVGSHNQSLGGVKAGTKECQFLIRDQVIVNGLIRRFEDLYTSIQAEKVA